MPSSIKEVKGNKSAGNADNSQQAPEAQEGSKALVQENAPAPAQEVKKSDLMEAVKQAVSDGLKEKATKDESDLKFSEDAIVKAVQSAFDAAEKNLKKDENLVGKIESIVADAAGKAFNSMREEKKSLHNVEEANTPKIDRPVSNSKGNLPLWIKQLVNIGTGKSMNEGVDQSQLTKASNDHDRWTKSFKSLGAKALYVANANQGAEFIPDDLSSQLLNRFYLNSQVAQFFLSREMVMPTNPYTFPLSTTRPTLYFEAIDEGVEATETTPGTSSVVLNAAKFLAKSIMSYEIDEDSIIQAAPFIVDQLSQGAVDGWEDTILNGDSAVTHQDSDVTNAKDRRKAFDGLRKHAIAGSLTLDMSVGGITYNNLLSLKRLMKKYAVSVRDLVYIVSPSVYFSMQAMDEVKTLDVFGSNALINTGEIPAVGGIPIIVSEQFREDLNATGVYDGVTTTQTGIILVNTQPWIVGRRRDFMLETDRDISNQTIEFVMSMRRTMVPQEAPTTNLPFIAYGYNITA